MVDEFHLLSHCGVDLGTCQVNVLINLGLNRGKDGTEGSTRETIPYFFTGDLLPSLKARGCYNKSLGKYD